MLYNKISLKAFLVLEKKNFEVFFYHYIGRVAILFNDVEPFE